MRQPFPISIFISAALLAGNTSLTGAQSTAAPTTPSLTAAQDHQNMMEQLGIKHLRPGPSGDEKAPDHANYDESKANPYPNLPEALRLNKGQPVTTAKEWWQIRRPQIVEAFEEMSTARFQRTYPLSTGRSGQSTRRQSAATPS